MIPFMNTFVVYRCVGDRIVRAPRSRSCSTMVALDAVECSHCSHDPRDWRQTAALLTFRAPECLQALAEHTFQAGCMFTAPPPAAEMP